MNTGLPLPTPRRLLARVRDVMAASGTAQEHLDQTVSIIAADMVAEVCSVYVRRAGDVLELFATEGLNKSAVHNTRLRVGEGLIGEIAASARPFALSDAQKHPSFAYRPETGEEIYHSLMGVPVIRGGRVIGVLSVQNRSRRNYSEEEVESLQTVAMVLAELVSGGELISREEQIPADGIALLPLRIEGTRLNAGLGIGEAVLHRPRVIIERFVAEDPTVENERLRQALSEMHGALDDMLRVAGFQTGKGDHIDVLETYRMFAEDAGWFARIKEAINTGLTAEAAVQKVHNSIRTRMGKISDPYLRERIEDFEDLAERLLQHLVGSENSSDQIFFPEDAILIARTMGPAQLLDYDRTHIRGLILEEGSPTSHVAIVARALDIPVVGNVRGILDKIEQGEQVIVDGDNGQVFVRPGDDVRQAFLVNFQSREIQKAAYASLRDLPAVSKDGIRIQLELNAGLLVDLQQLEEAGADGIGLYRTEIPFMVRSDFPGVEEQRSLYAKILDQAGNKPVAFRTLDVGGDKVLPYWDDAKEENPAMGWRAIRISLDRPFILRQQLRALIQAAAGRNLKVMFPMVTELGEFTAARKILNLELERESGRGGTLPLQIHCGAMLEVPALLFQLSGLLKEVDFLSVGSNDLFQFLFAADRGNPDLWERYDLISPLVFSILKPIVDNCREAGVPLCLCGEMAGDPLGAMALIGLGFREISLAPHAVGPVKAMIRSLDVASLETYLATLGQTDLHNVRENIRSYAQDHGVNL
ncbi:MAG: phosphoenolpyruvate--protein phosphotransferase [Rhodospirillales bacterium]|nr:phosphoenolpyruvate--protein phosphotransferase [Rhodospirillales bacterium]